MPTLFDWKTGSYNVVGSFNNFFKSNINASLPLFQGTTVFPIVYNYPDEPLQLPSFSVTHLGNFDTSIAQGDRVDAGLKGQYVTAIAEVSAWVNAKDNYTWPRDLMVMADMIRKLFSGTRTLTIIDVYSSTTAGDQTGYILRIQKAEEVDVPPDPNPNVKRRRFLVTYGWVQRQ